MRKPNPIDITKLRNGIKVKYSLPDSGYDGDKKICQKYLKLGGEYTVVGFNIGNWSTTIYLHGMMFLGRPVPFNAIMFSEVKTRNRK